MDVVTQEDFYSSGSTVVERLRDVIRECDATIHLVGRRCGELVPDTAQSSIRDIDEVSRFHEQTVDQLLSYAQYEYFLAKQFAKPTFLFVTWQTTLDQLGPNELNLLNVLAWFAPEPLPQSVLNGFSAEEEGNAELARDAEEEKLRDWLATLADFSLIRWDVEAKTVTVHRVLQEILQTRQPDRKENFVEALRILNEASPTDVYDVRFWPIIDPLRPHLAFVAQAADQAAIHQPTTRVMSILAELLRIKALYAEAEPLHRRALAIDEQSYGAEHPKGARRLNNLATLLQATNRLAEAEPLMRRALEIDEQSYGADHPSVAVRLHNLASLLQNTGRTEEAEPLMRRALLIFQHALGTEHPNVMTVARNYEILLGSMGVEKTDISTRISALMVREFITGRGTGDSAGRIENTTGSVETHD